ncbi:helix-turn-helix domain-containing protein [Nocardioides sp.]|uniref:helix-turn-helix domain-containing protein n=1 Tax=Nocardioides sp. TaxID=35761 RepID=UPI002C5E2C37|nr:helix-turn-helix domain-containing protein [Nocardioides sp.]HXH77280.1 helix-turn-helix domain-containing protein [Nocardioides sp.]
MDTPPLDAERFSAAVAEAVENLRWEKRFRSARQLALAASMTHTYLNARLSGSVPFNVADIAALANTFDVRPDFIFDRAFELMVSEDAPSLGAVASTETEIEGAGENSI